MKIRIRRTRKATFRDMAAYCAMICLFSFAMLEHTSVAISIFADVKYPLLCIGGVCLLPQIGLVLGNWKKKKYFFILVTLLALIGALLYSAILSKSSGVGIYGMRATTRLIMYLAELFILMMWLAERRKFEEALEFLFWYTVILTVVTDFLFISGIVRFWNRGFENYLVGTKFSVSYLHLNLVALWYNRNNLRFHRDSRAKQFIYLMIPLVLIVSLRVDCMTGLVGTILLFVCYAILNTKFQKKLIQFTSPNMVIIALVVTLVFLFVVNELVRLPAVQYLIEDLLGRDLTMTGRVVAYNQVPRKMQKYLLWGVGYGNGNTAAENMFRIANTQNAQVHWVLQGGIVSTLLIDTLLLQVFRILHRSPARQEIMPLVVLVYIYIVLGAVETTFNMYFFLLIMLILARVSQRETNPSLNERNLKV